MPNLKFFKAAVGVGGVYAASILGVCALAKSTIDAEIEKNAGKQRIWTHVPTRAGMIPHLVFVEPLLDTTEAISSMTTSRL